MSCKTDRDRLIELCNEKINTMKFNNSDHWFDFTEKIKEVADHLLANGIIVPPCKVGDTYYTIERYCNTDPFETEKELVKPWDCERFCGRADCSFREHRIEEHQFNSVIRILEAQKYFGKTVFLTKEEAEENLKEREGK